MSESTSVRSVPHVLRSLRLRGSGLAEDVAAREPSSAIEEEGTAVPGPGVRVEEGYMEKLRQEEENVPSLEELLRDDGPDEEPYENYLNPTADQVAEMREAYYREHPDEVRDVNETLLFETRRGNITGIQGAIADGADMEHRDDDGDTALILSCIDGNVRNPSRPESQNRNQTCGSALP
jgi:hypothetical protein